MAEEKYLELIRIFEDALRELGIEKKFSLDSNLREDLGLDSLTCMEVVQYVEENVGVRISNEAYNNLKTVKDLCDYIIKEESRLVKEA